jgi:tetratricopeptide (TPR) repeat protein
LQGALAIREQQLSPNHPETATTLGNLGGLYIEQGEYEQAEPLYQHALAIFEQQPNHPDTATCLSNFANLYMEQGKYEQAEPLYQHALAIRERVLGPGHPNTRTIQENYTNLLQKIKDKQELQD